MIDYELFCHTCGHVTKFSSDELTVDGRYEVLLCGHCKQAYMIHKRNVYRVPEVYRLTRTHSFVRMGEKNEDEKEESNQAVSE